MVGTLKSSIYRWIVNSKPSIYGNPSEESDGKWGRGKQHFGDGSKPIMRCFKEMHHPKTMLFCLEKQGTERGYLNMQIVILKTDDQVVNLKPHLSPDLSDPVSGHLPIHLMIRPHGDFFKVLRETTRNHPRYFFSKCLMGKIVASPSRN